MAIRFVVGGAGSGKTHFALGEVRREAAVRPDGPPLILLVPEQASYQTERALLSADLRGTTRARVLSFARLGQWVQSLGPASALPRLTDIHRRVLVTSILARARRDPSPGTIARVRSIDKSVAEVLGELKQFRVPAQVLADWGRMLAGEDPVLAGKLDELSRVAFEYDARVRDRFEDPEESLASMRDTIRVLPELQGARVYVDGFHGFTPVEMEVLRGLAHRCTELTLCLTIGFDRFELLRRGEEPDTQSRTLPVEETVEELLAMARDEGVSSSEVVRLPVANQQATRFGARALATLERAFLVPGSGAAQAMPDGAIALRVAENDADEARLAVEQLLDWRAEHGWAWGAMAVITRDLDRYARPLEDALQVLGIPYFLDRHESLETHPVIQGVMAALEIALGPWRSETVLDFAKSGLFPFDADAVALLEEFALAYPRVPLQWLANTAWKSPPRRSPFEDPGEAQDDADPRVEAIDRTRRAVVTPLRDFMAAIGEARTDEGIEMRLFLSAVCELIHAGMPQPDDATLGVLSEIGEFYECMIEASHGERFAPDVLLDLMRETFARLQLPRIPPALDQVLVGQIDRSRFHAVRGAVVLGLAEGRFPAPGTNATLLTDRERESLEALTGDGPRLRPSSKRLFQRESFLALLAFTRASDALGLTRPRSDTQGGALPPSPYWQEVRRLYPALAEETAAPALSESRVLLAREAAAYFCREVLETREREAPPARALPVDALFAQLTTTQRADFAQVVDSAMRRNEAALDPAVARELVGANMRTSVSALESYASCPFQYFMRAMMAPQVPQDPKVSPADIGNLAHAALKELTDRLLAEGRGYGDLSDAEIPDAVHEAFQPPLARLRETGLFQRQDSKAIAELVMQQVEQVVGFLSRAARHLRAQPLVAEARFGTRGAMDALEFPVALDDGSTITVQLRGQIDRVDLARDARGTPWIIVVDFKLGARKLNWIEAADGKSLQLASYLLVLRAGGSKLVPGEPLRVAGAFYLPIIAREDEERQFRGVTPVSAWEELSMGDGPDGVPLVKGSEKARVATPRTGDVISDRQFESLMDRTREHIERHVRDIASGGIEVRPAMVGKSTPCGMCDYKAACRLDYAMNTRRMVATLPRDQAIEEWLGPP